MSGELVSVAIAAGAVGAMGISSKDARVTIRHQAGVEKGVIRSSGILYVDPAATAKGLGAVEASVDKTGSALIDCRRRASRLWALDFGL